MAHMGIHGPITPFIKRQIDLVGGRKLRKYGSLSLKLLIDEVCQNSYISIRYR